MEERNLEDIMQCNKELILDISCAKNKKGEPICFVAELGKFVSAGPIGIEKRFEMIGRILTDGIDDAINYLPGAYDYEAEWVMSNYLTRGNGSFDYDKENEAEKFFVDGGLAQIRCARDGHFVGDITLGQFESIVDGESLEEVIGAISYFNENIRTKTFDDETVM